VGHSALDHVYRIEQFPARPSKVRALEHLEGGGGSAANAAVTIARLGGAVEFWSRVGADDAGRRILAGLRAHDVDTRFVLVHQGSRSSESAVIVDRTGERLIVSERDHAMPADAGWLPLDHIPEAAAVLSDLRWFEATSVSFREARKHGVRTVLDIDIGGGGSDISAYLALTDYAIFSAPALAGYLSEGTDCDRLGKVLERGVQHAGVTLGAEGYVWRARDGTSGRQPSFEVDVVDSTGAGDAFHGAFAWALAHGHDDASCAKIGAAVAALKCRKLGAREGLPRLRELEDFLGASFASITPPPT
jgi:sulfofructose kinase